MLVAGDYRLRKGRFIMGTVIVGAVLVLIVGCIIRGLVKDKKNGKTSCGGDCAHCHGCKP